ncbi:MAG: BON domain-containing protein [Rhodospirillaceae bacterium]
MNTAKQTILAAAFSAVALSVVACAPTATRESPGEYAGDAAVTAKVKTALIKEPGVKANAINVETFRGVVQLSGFVDTQDMADRAVAAASRVGGVKSVKNDMRLKLAQ